ncbi:MAG: hypothetical protein AAFV88_08825 [Planctomycetota bacterium]
MSRTYCLVLLAIAIVCPRESLSQTLPNAIPSVLAPQAEADVPRFRKQFFQGFDVRAGFFGDVKGGGEAVNQTFQDVRASFGVPLFSLDNLLAVSPSFRVDQVDGPEGIGVDVPETLYNVGVTFFHRKQWAPRISTLLLVTPSIRSDFSTSQNAYRTFGLGVVNWQWRDDFQWTFGAVFLDRADLGVLPVIGATWTPSPWWKIELTMPRPRISRRLWKQAAEAESWAYVGLGLGGNTWSVTRVESGVERIDEFSIRSIDLQFGIETIRAGNRGWFTEGGYAFARQLEYESDTLEQDLADALFLRAGIQF